MPFPHFCQSSSSGFRLQSVAPSMKLHKANAPRQPLKCLLFSSFCGNFTECFQLECLHSHLSDMSVIGVLCLEGYSGPVWER